MTKFTESHIEDTALDWFSGLGYAVAHGPEISPDGPTPERVSYDQVLLVTRLQGALERINPHLPKPMPGLIHMLEAEKVVEVAG